MISARGRARTRRFLLIGLMLSLMVHLAGGSLYGLVSRAVVKALPQLASLQTPPLPKSDIIRLEKAQPTAAPVVASKPFPKPVPRAAPPPPVPRVAPVPLVAPAEQQHEIVHITKFAPHRQAQSHGPSVAIVPNVPHPAVAPPAQKQPYLSDDRTAQMNSAFEQAIAASHQTVQQANAAMNTTPVVTKTHMHMNFNGIHEGMNPGDGIITIIGEPQHIGKITYYYTHYEYMYADGHVEEDDIPWPFHYGPGERDPWINPYPDHRIPLQPPPPGYVRTRELKPQLMQFFGGPEVR
jgi:hypothetical protein